MSTDIYYYLLLYKLFRVDCEKGLFFVCNIVCPNFRVYKLYRKKSYLCHCVVLHIYTSTNIRCLKDFVMFSKLLRGTYQHYWFFLLPYLIRTETKCFGAGCSSLGSWLKINDRILIDILFCLFQI